ncbi:MAG: transporter substrate-binding domain-containing protein [Hyphomicrobiales bacterium]|nr:transporter substrate-binding domain-containing protein [Alphaproteobacteria bacterium]
MFKVFGRAVLLWILFAGLTPPAGAQTAPQEIKVATRVLPPMVVQQGDTLTGFSIDLWNAISEKLNLKTSYQTAPDVRSLLDQVRTGNAEVGIAAISITAAREAEFDFSQPMLNAGLQIMVRGKAKDGDANPLWDLLSLLFSPTILVWLGIAFLLVLVPAHLVWLLERHHPSGIIPTPNYIPGIFYALFWASSTLATQGEQMPRHWLARVIAILWMFTGVVFVAFYTAQLAATLTVQQIQGGINGPDDLQGKHVATTRGSTAAAALRELRAQVEEVSRIDDAYTALIDKQVDAVVFDSPVLLYYAANTGKGQVHLIGTPFRKEDYGIVFQPNNPLRKRVNNALLALREDGTYQKIHDKWFAVK